MLLVWMIFPNIEVDTVDGKCVIVVEIYPGASRPYYIKSLGKCVAIKKRMIEAARTNSEEAKGESCMEFEKFEEIYQVLEAQKEKDETATELYADVKEFAYKYATMRYQFSKMSREEKAENDSYRTSQHNRFMDSVRIYLRYLQNNGVSVPDISKLEADRKIFGNFACYYIFRIECEQA